jgi:hypothetical protein
MPRSSNCNNCLSMHAHPSSCLTHCTRRPVCVHVSHHKMDRQTVVAALLLRASIVTVANLVASSITAPKELPYGKLQSWLPSLCSRNQRHTQPKRIQNIIANPPLVNMSLSRTWPLPIEYTYHMQQWQAQNGPICDPPAFLAWAFVLTQSSDAGLCDHILRRGPLSPQIACMTQTFNPPPSPSPPPFPAPPPSLVACIMPCIFITSTRKKATISCG